MKWETLSLYYSRCQRLIGTNLLHRVQIRSLFNYFLHLFFACGVLSHAHTHIDTPTKYNLKLIIILCTPHVLRILHIVSYRIVCAKLHKFGCGFGIFSIHHSFHQPFIHPFSLCALAIHTLPSCIQFI